jgi:hypothetical protein
MNEGPSQRIGWLLTLIGLLAAETLAVWLLVA